MERTLVQRSKRPSLTPALSPVMAPPDVGQARLVGPAGSLGQLLVSRGLLSVADLHPVLEWQRTLTRDWPVQRLGSLLVKAGILSVREVSDALAGQRGIAAAVEMPRQMPPLLQGLFPQEVLRLTGAVPLYVAGRTVVMAMVDPQDRRQVAALQALTDYAVQPVLALQFQVHKLLRYLPPSPMMAGGARQAAVPPLQ